MGGEGTTWGKKRIEHGHPRPYSLKYIELGNVSSSLLYCTLY